MNLINFFKNKIVEREFSIISNITDIRCINNEMFLTQLSNEDFENCLRSIRESENFYVKYLSGLVVFFDTKDPFDNEFAISLKKRNEHVMLLNDLIDIGLEIIKKEKENEFYIDILYSLFLLSKKGSKKESKYKINEILDLIITKKINDSVSRFLEKHVDRKSVDTKRINSFFGKLKKEDISEVTNEECLILLRKIYQRFDVNIPSYLNKKIKETKIRNVNELKERLDGNMNLFSNKLFDDFINELIDHFLEKDYHETIDFIVWFLYKKDESKSFVNLCKKYIFDINKNMSESDFGTIELAVFKILNNLVVYQFSKIDKKDTIKKIRDSSILSEKQKDMICLIIDNFINLTHPMLCIDSLALKFEGIFRKILKSNGIETIYVDDKGNMGESTLGQILERIDEIENGNYIKYISVILNQRGIYGIRNNVAHSFYEEVDLYTTFLMEQLILCISLTVELDLKKQNIHNH